jgi:sugar transferase (PEP-CTERM/EpsH1 system associated)
VKPIRIMHVVRTLATGGMETVVRRLVSALDPDQFQQTVCTLISAPCEQPPGTICLGRSPGEAAFLVPQLTRLFRRERPDIVHSRNWATIEAVVAAKLAGVRCIVHSEHGRDLHTMGPQPWRRRLLRRISYACADRVFCVSRELRNYYCRQLAMKTSSLDVIANGVDVGQFAPNPKARSERRTSLGIGPRTIVVGTVGRLDPVKDHVTLLRAADATLKKSVELRLVIVGDGLQQTALENELKSRPDLARRTFFTGDVSNVADWLSSFDIFVLPSLSEGMSNTLLEAMAVGIAPIATAVGGNVEVVEHGRSGMLVPPGDAEAICAFLIQLATADEHRRVLGRNARERVIMHFSFERMLKRYEEMYCDLMTARDVRRANPGQTRTDSYARNCTPNDRVA